MMPPPPLAMVVPSVAPMIWPEAPWIVIVPPPDVARMPAPPLVLWTVMSLLMLTVMLPVVDVALMPLVVPVTLSFTVMVVAPAWALVRMPGPPALLMATLLVTLMVPVPVLEVPTPLVPIDVMVPPGEDTAVHQGMQCLDAAVHHLGEPRDLGDADDGEACLLQNLRSAARGDEIESPARQRGSELDQAGFVRNAQ